MKLRYAVVFVLLAAAGCASRASAPAPLPYVQSQSALISPHLTGAGKITHVIYVIQENRSFDNLFQGYPNADTSPTGMNSQGQTITLQPASLSMQYQIDHSAYAMFAACNGTGSLPGTNCKMNGFDNEESYGGPTNPQYVYVPHNESKPYFDIAHEWVVGDRMFQSQLDESFVAHQYAIAAQAQGSVDLPGYLWGCEGGPSDTVSTITQNRNPNGPQQQACFDYTTLGDELDKAKPKLSWRFYAVHYTNDGGGNGGTWSGYQAVNHIFNGPDWKNVISPNWKFITDVRAGKLANFTWITPECPESDHTECSGGGYGPSWVSAIVNTVGKSKFWDSTAIFVQWDDWGGYYDHVAPAFEDYDGVGFRVPLLVISPYAKKDYVSHTPYETASVLRFAEDLYGLPQMAAADTRAASPAADCFDFTQQPRAFIPIKAPYPASFFIRHRFANSDVIPDRE